MAPKKTALAKVEQGGGLVVAAWMKEMQGKAREVSAIFRTGVPRITQPMGQLMVDGMQVKDNKLPVVIIEAAFEKCYYSKGYNPDEKVTPDCYSLHAADRPAGEAHAEMVPNPQCKDRQNDTCAGCKWNRFNTAKPREGSDKPGKGKRCSDKVRLLCLSLAAGANKESIIKAEVRLFSIPSNSLGNWGAYVSKLAEIGVLPQMVVTQISTTTEGVPQGFKDTFEAIRSLDQEQYLQIEEKQKLALQTLLMPYPALDSGEAEAEETPAQKKANAKRKAKVQ